MKIGQALGRRIAASVLKDAVDGAIGLRLVQHVLSKSARGERIGGGAPQ
jgi:hypothetical protein